MRTDSRTERRPEPAPPKPKEWLWFLLIWAASAAAFVGSVWALRCGVAWMM
ncbi:MAG: hypothetical protein ACT4P0_11200 [Panacagrimonas sp.]